MNHMFRKGLFIAGIALLTVPFTVFGQKEKEEKKKNEKEEVQHITITRNGDTKEKMVIEINGDQVKINGKDLKDNKDVHVNINRIKGGDIRWRNGARAGNFNFDFNDDMNMSLFSEDANRAMLGVVTEGRDKGAEIMSITKNSAAEKSGLRKGDILLKIGDRNIESTDDVTESIHEHKPGEKIPITYMRDGKEQKVSVELGKWNGIKMNAVSVPKISGLGEQFREFSQMDAPMMFERNGTIFPASRPRLGLSIQDTDDGVGVKVLDVDEESNAAKAGIKEGDVIVGVNDHEVKSTDDVSKAIREKEKYIFNFRVNRNGKTQNIEVKMPRKLKTADL